MRTIIRIEHIQRWETAGVIHSRTHALLDDGTECAGYGEDFEVGDEVEVFFNEKYNAITMQKPIDKDKQQR